jgi:hypothetical protein
MEVDWASEITLPPVPTALKLILARPRLVPGFAAVAVFAALGIFALVIVIFEPEFAPGWSLPSLERLVSRS